MRSRKAVLAILLALAGIAILAAPAALELAVFTRPNGTRVGTWSGPVEVLAVEGDWARVRMVGWVPKEQVAPAAPSGTRLEGSPGGGIWVSDLALRRSLAGYVRVTAWITNSVGHDIDMLFLGVVLLKDDGSLVGVFSDMISSLPDGATKAFSSLLPVEYSPFFKVLLQYEGCRLKKIRGGADQSLSLIVWGPSHPVSRFAGS